MFINSNPFFFFLGSHNKAMSKKREAKQNIQNSRNVRQRVNDESSSSNRLINEEPLQQPTYDERVEIILGEHPCKHNTRDNKCVSENNPFGFRYRDTDECMDFSKEFYPLDYMGHMRNSLSRRLFLKSCVENTPRIHRSAYITNLKKELARRKNMELRELNNEYKNHIDLELAASSTPLIASINNIISEYATSFNTSDYTTPYTAPDDDDDSE